MTGQSFRVPGIRRAAVSQSLHVGAASESIGTGSSRGKAARRQRKERAFCDGSQSRRPAERGGSKQSRDVSDDVFVPHKGSFVAR